MLALEDTSWASIMARLCVQRSQQASSKQERLQHLLNLIVMFSWDVQPVLSYLLHAGT